MHTVCGGGRGNTGNTFPAYNTKVQINKWRNSKGLLKWFLTSPPPPKTKNILSL